MDCLVYDFWFLNAVQYLQLPIFWPLNGCGKSMNNGEHSSHQAFKYHQLNTFRLEILFTSGILLCPEECGNNNRYFETLFTHIAYCIYMNCYVDSRSIFADTWHAWQHLSRGSRPLGQYLFCSKDLKVSANLYITSSGEAWRDWGG